MGYFAIEGHSLFTVVGWIVIYLAILSSLAVAAKKVGDQSADLAVLFFSVLMSGVLPGMMGTVIERQPVIFHATPPEREVIYHLSFTLSSALALALWSISLAWSGMGKGHLPPLLRLGILLPGIAGGVAILMALVEPQWFTGFNAYMEHHNYPGVWPSVIAAPISIVRITLVTVSLAIPLLRWQMNGSPQLEVQK